MAEVPALLGAPPTLMSPVCNPADGRRSSKVNERHSPRLVRTLDLGKRLGSGRAHTCGSACGISARCLASSHMQMSGKYTNLSLFRHNRRLIRTINIDPAADGQGLHSELAAISRSIDLRGSCELPAGVRGCGGCMWQRSGLHGCLLGDIWRRGACTRPLG